MRNRIVGVLVIVIALLIGFIIYTFNTSMTSIINESCSHGPECAMWGTLEFQTNVSLGVMVFVIIIGLYLIFFSKEEKIVTKMITKIRTVKPQIESEKITKENYQKIMSSLDNDEKILLEKIIDAKGSVAQSELVGKTEFNKVKVTRILDKLEGKGIIERKRRGMTNVVILKHKKE